ncbi:MAG: hypothetical protein SGJ09_09600 [Phycisphaerae bacterium]|nr:hypothetical protein [Phycisphaerae bacterium]
MAAGIERVVFIEPYEKSKAAEFHDDSIAVSLPMGGDKKPDGKVSFEPFVGVGPRRFFDLFSTRLGSGYRLKRKDPDGPRVDWELKKSKLRLQMIPLSYLELEKIASRMLDLVRTPTNVKNETKDGA